MIVGSGIAGIASTIQTSYKSSNCREKKLYPELYNLTEMVLKLVPKLSLHHARHCYWNFEAKTSSDYFQFWNNSKSDVIL
jgi:hypothetical protein